MGKSRKHIEKTTISELDAACNGLVTQTLSIMQSARDRMEEVDANTDNIAKPLSDELLELTRKDGTSITTSLGKRMKAYRELVTREEKTLNELFEQWVEVSRRIDDFGTKHFGPTGVKSLKSKTNADMAECEGGEEQEVVARLAAERKRVLDAAAAAGEKAMKAVRANETVCSFLTLKRH